MTNELHQDVKVYGKIEATDKENTLLGIGAESPNLFDYTKIVTQTHEGITYVNNGDGTFTVSGTATSQSYTSTNILAFTLNRGTYTMKRTTGAANVLIGFRLIDGGVIKYPDDTFTVENNNAEVYLYLNIASGRQIPVGTIVKPMVNFGLVSLPFQPYTGKIQHDINRSYSYEEIDTRATWVDGKKIYKKTFASTSSITLPGTERTQVETITLQHAHIIDFKVLSTMANYDYCGIATTYGLWECVSFGTSSLGIYFQSKTSSNITLTNKIVTLYYTK